MFDFGQRDRLFAQRARNFDRTLGELLEWLINWQTPIKMCVLKGPSDFQFGNQFQIGQN